MSSGIYTDVHPGTVLGENVRISSFVVIEEGCEIGGGTFLGVGCVLRPNTKIGKNCVIGHYCIFEGGCVVGDGVTIGPHGVITRNAVVGDEVFFGPHYVGINDRKMGYHRKDVVLTPPLIKRAVRIGCSVVVLPGVIVGENSVVGACSVVTKDVAPRTIVFGAPARVKGEVPEEEIL